MILICVKSWISRFFCVRVKLFFGIYLLHDEKNVYTYRIIRSLYEWQDSPEEEQTLLAWFSDPDHKEEIMAFYKSRWEESSGKKLPPKLQGQMFCEIKKRIRQEKKTLEIKKKP